MPTTQRENLLRTLRRQGFDWTPLDPGSFCPFQVEAFKQRFGHDDIAGFFGSPVRSFGIGVKPACADWRPQYRRETLPADIDFDAFGVGISFWSTIGTQATLPFGTPDEVKAVVRRNLEICGKAGGIVIGPTHMVEPEVPWVNLLAMKEACEAFRGQSRVVAGWTRYHATRQEERD